MSSMEDQLKCMEEENAKLKQELEEAQKLLTNMGNELEELYEVIKGLEKERDDANAELAKMKE
jgi:septal ring factor EnvC (AmiA/AmiB activator)